MKTYVIPDKPKLKQIAIDGLIIGGFGIVIATAITLHIGLRFYLGRVGGGLNSNPGKGSCHSGYILDSRTGEEHPKGIPAPSGAV